MAADLASKSAELVLQTPRIHLAPVCSGKDKPL